jgi:hypothetical protein
MYMLLLRHIRQADDILTTPTSDSAPLKAHTIFSLFHYLRVAYCQ